MSRWKQEHRFLYNEDGSPTKNLEKLREELAEDELDNPPQSDDLSNKFPTIQVSSGADKMINRLLNVSAALGRVVPLDEEGEEDNDYKIRVLYGCLNDAREALYEYIEALEYEVGITRNISKRF